MPSTVIESLAVVLPTLLVAIPVLRYRRSEPVRAFVPALLLTGLSTSVLVATYVWLFEVGENCSDRFDLACQLNANQGVLTLFGLLLAAAAIWTTLITLAAEQRQQDRKFRDRANKALLAALGECHHNLVHVAMASKNRRLTFVPQISSQATAILIQPELRVAYDSTLLFFVDRLLRCVENLPPAMSPWTGPSPVPKAMEGVIEHSLDLMIHAAKNYSAVSKFIAEPGLQDLRAVASGGAAYHCAALSSKATQHAHEMRNEGFALVCWWDDEPIEGVTSYQQAIRFGDMAHRDHPLPI